MTIRVVIDGSNLCKPNEALPWKMEYLELAMRDVMSAAKAANPSRNLELKVYIDAATYYRFSNQHDKDRFDELCSENKIERTPAGGPADHYILQWAMDHQAVIITNDQYREFQDRHSWIKDAGRSVSAMFDGSMRKWNFMERFAGKNTPRDLVEVLQSQPMLTTKPSSAAPVPPATPPTTPTTTPASPTTPTLVPSVSAAPGAYAKPIKRDAPCAVVLLVDQSGSMGEVWSGGGSKSVGVAESINNLLESLVMASIRNRGDVYPYFEVAVLGYGGGGKSAVRTLLPNSTVDNPILPIDKIHTFAKTEQSTRNGLIEERKVWVQPHHNGATPMCEAIMTATKVLTPWVQQHSHCFPPIVMNITDGVSTDGAPQIPARDLLNLKTDDGSVLFFNINISGFDEPPTASGAPTPPSPKKPQTGPAGAAKRLVYPSDSVKLPNEAARSLFEMSSVLPDALRKNANSREVSLEPGARGFIYNATSKDLTTFLEIGTPPAGP